MVTTQDRIVDRLRILSALYSHGAAEGNAVVAQSLDKIVAQELATAQQQAAELETDLQQFEVQYGMRSQDFYPRFRAGELGDDIDFVEWEALYRLWRSVQERLEILLPSESNECTQSNI